MRRGEAWKHLREYGPWMRVTERAVFLALLERSNNGDCAIPPRFTPGLDQLAEVVCCSRATVTRALAHLELHGWVKRTRSVGGARCKSTYQLTAGGVCKPGCALGCNEPARRSCSTCWDHAHL